MVAAVVLALRGSITIGTVVIFINNCNYLMQPIRMVPQLQAGRKAAAALVEKLVAVTEENVRGGGEAYLAQRKMHAEEDSETAHTVTQAILDIPESPTSQLRTGSKRVCCANMTESSS